MVTSGLNPETIDKYRQVSITSIRWTIQFIRVRRISDLYNPTWSKNFMGNASQVNRSRNSVRVERRSDLNKSDLGEVYCIFVIYMHTHTYTHVGRSGSVCGTVA